MKKILLMLMLFMVSFVYSINIDANPVKDNVVESALSVANPYEYDALNDSILADFGRHKVNTTYHEVADSTTVAPTINTSDLPMAIDTALDIKEYFEDHFANDSSHVSADITTVLPGDIGRRSTYNQYVIFLDSLRLAVVAHKLQTMSVNYNVYADSLITHYNAHLALEITQSVNIFADSLITYWNDHLARDTTDVDSCHYVPDIVYIMAIDTTNVDSTVAGIDRLRTRYSPHIDSETYHVVSDSTNIGIPDSLGASPTTKEIYVGLNAWKALLNLHFPTDSVHVKADPYIFLRSDLLTEGHLTADAVYTTSIDTTNQDSLADGINRLRPKYKLHIDSETYHTAEDSTNIGVPDSLTGSFTWNDILTTLNLWKPLLNLHMPTDSVHVDPDITNGYDRSDLTKIGHISADATEWTGEAHLDFKMSYYDKLTIQYIGSSVSTGASFYHYGSVDGLVWSYIDSLQISADGATLKHLNTNFYPYFKIVLNKRTDGTYKIQFQGGK